MAGLSSGDEGEIHDHSSSTTWVWSGSGSIRLPGFPVFGGAEMIQSPIGGSLPLWIVDEFKGKRFRGIIQKAV
jgi:hypothetical protein